MSGGFASYQDRIKERKEKKYEIIKKIYELARIERKKGIWKSFYSLLRDAEEKNLLSYEEGHLLLTMIDNGKRLNTIIKAIEELNNPKPKKPKGRPLKYPDCLRCIYHMVTEITEDDEEDDDTEYIEGMLIEPKGVLIECGKDMYRVFYPDVTKEEFYQNKTLVRHFKSLQKDIALRCGHFKK